MKNLKKIDHYDKKILSELNKNSRESFSRIGKRIGLSKQVVSYRVRNLIEEGIIEKFTTVLDIKKLGLLAFKVLLELNDVDLEKEKKIIKYLAEKDYVNWIVSSIGRYNVVFSLCIKPQYMEKAIYSLLSQYGNHIQNMSLLYLLSGLYRYDKPYLEQSPEYFYFKGSSPPTFIDKTDAKILKMLVANARTPIIEIADKTNISPISVRKRINRLLQRGVINRFRLKLNRELLGYSFCEVLLKVRMFRGMEESFLKFFKTQKNIIDFNTYLGKFNAGFKVEIKENTDLTRLLHELRKKFGHLIKNYECLFYEKEYKTDYFPVSQILNIHEPE